MLLPALAVLPGAAESQETQEVRGNVLEGDTGAMIEGAMVLLFDEAGRRVNGVLSGASGFFRVYVPAPGRYRLRVERIGYANTDTEPFDVAAGAIVQRQVTTVVQPIELAQLDITGSNRCQIRPEGVATAAVWEEVRKALAAATWTAERGMYRFAWVRFERRMAANGQRVLSEQRSANRQFAPQPFVAEDPQRLAEDGFIEMHSDGTWEYLAPDATVLISDPFLDTHCFRLEGLQEEGGRGLMGLAFEPVQGRDRSDVRGVLWLEAETARLRSLEYRYVSHPLGLPDNDAGGDLTFAELPNGTWIVKEWRIRMPNILEERDGQGRFRRYVITGYQHTGGIVQRAATASGTVVLDDTQGGITGVATDSIGQPLSGIRIWIAGTELADTTDSGGTFSIAGIGEGTWAVAAATPQLEMIGRVAELEVEVDQIGMRTVHLELPSVQKVARALCPTPPDGRRSVLLGRVVAATGAPASGAVVQVTWTTVGGVGNLRAQRGTFGLIADERGSFVQCDLPPSLLQIQGSSDGRESSAVQVAVGSGTEVVTVHVVLP